MNNDRTENLQPKFRVRSILVPKGPVKSIPLEELGRIHLGDEFMDMLAQTDVDFGDGLDEPPAPDSGP